MNQALKENHIVYITMMSVEDSSKGGSVPISSDNFTKLMKAIEATQTQLDCKLVKELMED